MKTDRATAVLSVFLVIFLAGCTSNVGPTSETTGTDWRDAELTDAVTGEGFSIRDFEGKPVLVESFAVWCPTCKAQQDKIKELHEQIGGDVVSISLDTDPNEDAAKVKGHANRYGYDWMFAVSPSEVTQSLIEEFGLSVVNAPTAPVILVCEDQSARLLQRGVKSTDTLISEIEKGC